MGNEPEPSTTRGVAVLLASGTGTQIGAALGARSFPAIGPAGAVAVRQLVAAVALLALARPSVRRMTWAQWWPTLLLAAVFATMNLMVYLTVDRVGLGLAITLEFLGPLAIALLGSRTRPDLLIAAAAGIGVYVLVLPDGSSDVLGIVFGLLSAVCWAAYILLNRVAGARLPGLQAPAIAATIAAVAYLPVLGMLIAQGRLWGPPLLYAVAAGVLSSVIPYAVDLVVLRTVSPRLFGVVMSAQPGLAALAGLVLLGQVPAGHEWVGIAIVAASNVAAVTLSDRRRRLQTVAHSAAGARVAPAVAGG